MTSPPDLIQAIRSGQLARVITALDAGAPVELNDGKGDPGLPLAMACFIGNGEIVRELILRGAKVNVGDNSAPSSPLAMAIRAGKTEVVKVLVEHGANVPPRMETGLTEQELMLARWKATNYGTAQPGAPVPGGPPVIEEIEIGRCYGTDTDVLDDEMRRTIARVSRKD